MTAGSLAVRLAKQALRAAAGASLEEMLDFEVAAQDECFRSADALE